MSRFSLTILAVAIILATPARDTDAAHLGTGEGNFIYEKCTSETSEFRTFCLGFIYGSDSSIEVRGVTAKSFTHCAPHNVIPTSIN